MSEPFLAEIKIVGFNFAPRGFAFCDGQLLQISQNEALFALLGTIYGGDGRTTFGLPDLRGRTPIHVNPDHGLGQRSGAETHALTTQETPGHSHSLSGTSDDADVQGPAGALFAKPPGKVGKPYGSPTAPVPMAAQAVSSTGGGVPHDNMQPYLTLNFVIALVGIFPSRN
jgi:microcystin-dependent protein